MQRQTPMSSPFNRGLVDDFNVTPIKSNPTQKQPHSQQQSRQAGVASTAQQRRGNVGNTGSTHNRATQQRQQQQAPNKSQQHPMRKRSQANTETKLPLIRFDHVTKYYDTGANKKERRPALSDLTLDIENGEFVFLIGHSGSGKSTLISMLTREIKPTEGEIIVSGERLSEIRNWKVPYYRRNIGCVFQDFRLLENKTIYENVAFILEIIGKPEKEIKALVPEALHIVGLDGKANKHPSQLSGGEQQRASIARAIINRPPILICDEPTGNLDPANTLGIMALLEKLNEIGHTILMATHDMDIIQKTGHRVIELSDGRMVRDSKTEGGIINA